MHSVITVIFAKIYQGLMYSLKINFEQKEKIDYQEMYTNRTKTIGIELFDNF